MAMVIRTNMQGLNTLNHMNKSGNVVKKSLEKISSGQRINSSSDDPSDHAITSRMRAQILALDSASANTQTGSSMLKVAEGALDDSSSILKTLKAKAIKAATDTNAAADRAAIQKEINQMVRQIDENALIDFNGQKLLDGSHSNATTATKTVLSTQALAEGTTIDTKLTDLVTRTGGGTGYPRYR